MLVKGEKILAQVTWKLSRKNLLIYFRGKSESCQETSIMFLEDLLSLMSIMLAEELLVILKLGHYCNISFDFYIIPFFLWIMNNFPRSILHISRIDTTFFKNFSFFCVCSQETRTLMLSAIGFVFLSSPTFVMLSLCDEWKWIFLNVTLAYFSRPIVGAWACEGTAMQGDAVFRALGDTLSKASAEADCVAAVLLHFIIGYPYFNSWLPQAINKE